MEKLQNPIDEKFDKLIEFGLKTGKIKKKVYIFLLNVMNQMMILL
jgi:hypothetical protein